MTDYQHIRLLIKQETKDQLDGLLELAEGEFDERFQQMEDKLSGFCKDNVDRDKRIREDLQSQIDNLKKNLEDFSHGAMTKVQTSALNSVSQEDKEPSNQPPPQQQQEQTDEDDLFG